MQNAKNLMLILSVNLSVGLVLLALVEVGFTFLYSHPARIPLSLLSTFRTYYYKLDRKIIQLLPDCARYDNYLLYTLRPGTCLFSNPEFSVSFRINSLGVRDDEQSLRTPRLVVIGDSFAMGWGVDQEETFAQILEMRTGVKVLNAAIASYGTVRELRILEKTDLSELKYLIIQYSHNDYNENQTFLENNTLPITDERKYRRYQKGIEERKYFFGKHVIDFSRMVLRNALKRLMQPARNHTGHKKDKQPDPHRLVPAKNPRHSHEAEAFINALLNSRIELYNVKILLLDLNSFGANDGHFLNAVSSKIATGDYPEYISNMNLIDVSEELTENMFFIIDNHLNAEGHKIIADILSETIEFEEIR